MADVLQNKTVSQCRNFFVNHRKRYGLERELDEYEREQGIVRPEKKDGDQAPSPDSGGSSVPSPINNGGQGRLSRNSNTQWTLGIRWGIWYWMLICNWGRLFFECWCSMSSFIRDVMITCTLNVGVQCQALIVMSWSRVLCVINHVLITCASSFDNILYSF